jgi:hypothetical protein
MELPPRTSGLGHGESQVFGPFKEAERGRRLPTVEGVNDAMKNWLNVQPQNVFLTE